MVSEHSKGRTDEGSSLSSVFSLIGSVFVGWIAKEFNLKPLNPFRVQQAEGPVPTVVSKGAHTG